MPTEAGKRPAKKNAGEVFDAKTNEPIIEGRDLAEEKQGLLEQLNSQAETLGALTSEVAELRQRSLPDGFLPLVAEYQDEEGNYARLAHNSILKDWAVELELADDPMTSGPRRVRSPNLGAAVEFVLAALEKQDAAREKREAREKKALMATEKKVLKALEKKAPKKKSNPKKSNPKTKKEK